MNNLNGSESLIREDAVSEAIIQMQLFGGLYPTGVSNCRKFEKNKHFFVRSAYSRSCIFKKLTRNSTMKL